MDATTYEIEIERPGRTLLLDVAAEVEPDVPADWIKHAASVASVTLERVRCAGCGNAVELTRAEEAQVERVIERVTLRQWEQERRAAAEDAA